MGLLKKASDGPGPFPLDNQAPYATDASAHHFPYPGSVTSISRPPTSLSQTSITDENPYPTSDPSISRTHTSYSQTSTINNIKKLGRMPEARKNNPDFKCPGKDTEYVRMLLHQTQIIERRPYWNILAAALTWILLAGFIVLPGTYTNFQNSEIIKAAQEDQSNLGNKILASIANRGLLLVAGVLCGIGALGILGLWLKWQSNYIWLMNKLLLPALLNCFMGLLSTLVNVLSKPDKTFSTIAIVTTSVTGGLSVILACAFFCYSYLLDQLKATHRNAYKDEESQDPKDAIAEKYGEQAMI